MIERVVGCVGGVAVYGPRAEAGRQRSEAADQMAADDHTSEQPRQDAEAAVEHAPQPGGGA